MTLPTPWRCELCNRPHVAQLPAKLPTTTFCQCAAKYQLTRDRVRRVLVCVVRAGRIVWADRLLPDDVEWKASAAPMGYGPGPNEKAD